MAKFVIECPQCGKYAQASSGLFGFIGGTKKVNCSCGYEIDVKTEKLASRQCPHCGNHVVFDQSKGDKAVCPVCHEPINTMAEQNKTVDFTCGQCGIQLRSSRGAKTYTCPLCGHENDVHERAAKEAIRASGQASVISFEGATDALIWKHPIEDFCLGSQLIVDESQEAIFYRDGQALDTFPAGQYTLETQRLPLLDKVTQLPVSNGSVFHSKVYFVNLITHMGIKWGVGQIKLYEPRYSLPVELGLHGSFNVKVTNARKLLLKVVGTAGGLNRNDLLDENGKGYFRDMITMQIRNRIATTIRSYGIDLMELDQYAIELSNALREQINPSLDEYGLQVTEFFISGVKMPTDRAFAEALDLHKEEKLNTIRAKVEARKNEDQVDVIHSKHALDLLSAKNEAELAQIKAQYEAQVKIMQGQADAQVYLAQASAEAEEMKRKGYTYQQETARKVGLEAMQNGIGGIGGGGGGGIGGDLTDMAMQFAVAGKVIGMVGDALDTAPIPSLIPTSAPAAPAADTWDCTCGQKGNAGKFCPGCGNPRPAPADTWDCSCGQTGNTGRFCPRCGKPRPEAPKSWDCGCGQTGNTGRFCANCGSPRPEGPVAWDCTCGQTGITGKFCPNCGNQKGM